MPRSRAPTRKKYNGETRRLLLAFDIGTTFSGISYSVLDPGNIPVIKPVTRFPCQEHVGGDSKIPTVIYYDANGTPRAVGAETLKEGIEADATEFGWRKACWFKLHMRPRKVDASSFRFHPHEEGLPALPDGKTVEQVFADYMRYLKECAKSYITDTHGASLWASVQEDILYVLTHPNGWGGAQQAQLRQSAILAGLIPDTEEGAACVTFVTEGEASLHFCLSNGLKLPQKKGEVYGVMIVDAGGGTIDLTTYRKLPDHTFAEIAVPQCHFQGSAYVTMRAESYFEDVLDGSKYVSDVETLTTRFDRHTKHVFKNEQEAHHIQFASVRERDSSLNIRSGRITIPGHRISEFFEPSIQCIVDAVKTQESTAQFPIKSAFLVGGFSASPWLYEKVRQAIEPLGITVSRPDTHVNKAVSDGAVSFFVDGAVSTRVARATYGVSTYQVYDSSNQEHLQRARHVQVHPALKVPILDQNFETILPKGTMVKQTKEFRRPYEYGAKERHELESRSLEILSYVGRSTEPRHWIGDNPAMYPVVCTVEADTSGIQARQMTDPTGSLYYEMDYEVILLFGLTELKAQLAWQEDGIEKRGPASIVYED